MSDRKEFLRVPFHFLFIVKKKEETVLQDKEEVQEVTVSQAAAKEISMDAVIAGSVLGSWEWLLAQLFLKIWFAHFELMCYKL